MVAGGLANCVNLISFSWTRDGTLRSCHLENLAQLPCVKELEFNGHDAGWYDARVLQKLTTLEKITVIMPSSTVARTLVPWMQVSVNALRSLTIICKSSTVITDDLLGSIVPSLGSLQSLHLTGCIRVTHQGVLPIIRGSTNGLGSIGLEGLSPRFDMAALTSGVAQGSSLRSLTSITLTLPILALIGISFRTWATNVNEMLSSSPLESFHIYGAFNTRTYSLLDVDTLFRSIVDNHAPRLRRFSMHRMAANLSAIRDICGRCTRLEELFVVIDHSDVLSRSTGLELARQLRVLHINFPANSLQLQQGEENHDAPVEDDCDSDEESERSLPILPESDALMLVRRCSPWLRTFGCNTRVWKVETMVLHDGADQVLGTERRLARYDSPDIPEQFLVVRTS